MKKVTLILAALALVLGISQCKKQEEPAHIGEKQHIVLTANNGNDGSKVSGSFTTTALNLKWENDDVVIVSGAARGSLTPTNGVGEATATFEGDVTIVGGSTVYFTVGSAPTSYLGQPGSADGCATWIKGYNHFVGESDYQSSGIYENVQMKMQYAVLKLDVSALGTTGTLTIATGGETIASVSDVSEIANAVHVAVPANNEAQYTFGIGDKTAAKDWPALNPNIFYMMNEGGAAIVVEPATFTVGMDGGTPIKVEFAPGNLYYDGSEWKFEANQWDYRTYEGKNSCIGGSVTTDGTPSGHWGMFGWSTLATPYGMSTSTEKTDYSGDFVDWGTVPGLPSAGEGKTWHMLSKAEWDYLINTRSVNGSTGFGHTCMWATLTNGVAGLIIFPDGYTGASEGLSSIPAGAAFLPAIGYREGSEVKDVGTVGRYWTSSPNESETAYRMRFGPNTAGTLSGNRLYGQPVRLVR